MKKVSSFFIFLASLCSLYARNPFEFADKQLKKYIPVKVAKEEKKEEEHSTKWKITETQHEATHIVEDHEGKIRAISLGSKN